MLVLNFICWRGMSTGTFFANKELLLLSINKYLNVNISNPHIVNPITVGREIIHKAEPFSISFGAAEFGLHAEK
jgi:hypothetical protein